MRFSDHETGSSATESPARSMRVLVTGGSGVLGRALRPLARAASRILVDAALATGVTVYVPPAGTHGLSDSLRR
jgi:hypothetical protein